MHPTTTTPAIRKVIKQLQQDFYTPLYLAIVFVLVMVIEWASQPNMVNLLVLNFIFGFSVCHATGQGLVYYKTRKIIYSKNYRKGLLRSNKLYRLFFWRTAALYGGYPLVFFTLLHFFGQNPVPVSHWLLLLGSMLTGMWNIKDRHMMHKLKRLRMQFERIV